MQDRRDFLKTTAAVTAASGLLGCSSQSSKSPGSAQPAVKGRKRRIIWNNDGDDLAIVAYHDTEGSETKIGTSDYRYPPPLWIRG